MELGVGVGWLAEEFAALGVPFNERGARMDEYIDVLRELWAPSGDPEKSTVAGKFVSFDACIMRPRPAKGTVPIVIGGHSPAAARRAGRRGDGFFPGGGTIEELTEMFALVRSEAEAAGRDPDAIELFSGGGRPGRSVFALGAGGRVAAERRGDDDGASPRRDGGGDDHRPIWANRPGLNAAGRRGGGDREPDGG